MATVPAITVLTVSAALQVGMVFALLGHLKLALARRPDRDELPTGRLLSLLNLALIPLVAVAGVLVDLWGVRPMVIAGSVGLTLSFLALSAGATYTRAVLAVGAAAASAGSLWVATVVLLPRGLFGPQELSASVQLGFVLIALGALLAPPLFDLLDHFAGFRRGMALLALLLLLPAFLASLPGPDDFPAPGKAADLLASLAGPTVWMAALVFFVYAPLESFVGVWTTAYLAGLRQPQLQSSWLAGFWCSVATSRLGFAVVQHTADLRDTGGGWFLVLPALLAAVALGNLIGTVNPLKAFWGLVVLGLALGPLFPILIGLVFHNDPDHAVQGSLFGLVNVGGSLGCLLLAPLVNRSAGTRSIQVALRVPLFLALTLTAVSVLFVLLTA